MCINPTASCPRLQGDPSVGVISGLVACPHFFLLIKMFDWLAFNNLFPYEVLLPFIVMPLQSLTECFTGRQHKIFKQSWKGKQNCATWPYNVWRDTRAMKHITDSMLSLLSEEHTGRLDYQSPVKYTSGSRIVIERIALPAMTCH